MANPLTLAAVIIGFILIVGLILFWYVAARQHRQSNELFTALLLMLSWMIFGILQTNFDPVDTLYWIFQFATECCAIVMWVLMGIFWARLTGPSAKSGWIMLCLLGTILDLAALLIRIRFPDYGIVFQSFYNATSVTFYGGLIGLGVGLGIQTYLGMYRHTRERTALLLLFGLLLMNIGWLIGLIQYLGQTITALLPPWWSGLRVLNIIITIAGAIVYWAVSLAKGDYIYSLPFDVHLLLVISRVSGLPNYEARIKAHKPIQIDPALLAALFLAINSIFQEVGRKEIALESVAGPGLRFLIEWGQGVATVVVADRDTYFLREAVKQFTRDFEVRFAEKIEAGTPDLSEYDEAEEIIKRNFPYFTIQDESS